jgi:hypothetical protein
LCGYTPHAGGVLTIKEWEAYAYPDFMTDLEEMVGLVWIDTSVIFREATPRQPLDEPAGPRGSHSHMSYWLNLARLSLWWYNPWGSPGNYWEPTDYSEEFTFGAEGDYYDYRPMYFRKPGQYAVVYQVRDAGGNWNTSTSDPDPDHGTEYYAVYVYAPRDCAGSVWYDYVGTGVDNWSNFIYAFMRLGGFDMGDYGLAYQHSHGWGPDRNFLSPPSWFYDPAAGLCNGLTLYPQTQSANVTLVQPAYVYQEIPFPYERAYGYRSFLSSSGQPAGGTMWGTLTTVSFVQRLGMHWAQKHGTLTTTTHRSRASNYSDVNEPWSRIAIGNMSNSANPHVLPNGHTRMTHRGAHFEIAYPIVWQEPDQTPNNPNDPDDRGNHVLEHLPYVFGQSNPGAMYNQQEAYDIINAIWYCWRGDPVVGSSQGNMHADFNRDDGLFKNMMYDLPGEDEGWVGDPEEQVWIYVHDSSGLDWDPEGPGAPGYPYQFISLWGLDGVRIISERDEGAGQAGDINDYTRDKIVVVLPDPVDNDGFPFPPCGGGGLSAGAGGDPAWFDRLIDGSFDPSGFPQLEELVDNRPTLTIEEIKKALGIKECPCASPPKHN